MRVVVDKGLLSSAVLLLVAWLSISSSSVLVLLSGVEAIQAAFWRVALSSLVLGSVGFFSGLRRLVVNKLTVVAGVMLSIHFLTWMLSLFLYQFH